MGIQGYLGVLPAARLVEGLDRAVGSSELDPQPSRTGLTCLLAYLADLHGRPQVDSLWTGSAAWAVGRAARPGPADTGWLPAFQGVAKHSRDAFASALPAPGDGEAPAPSFEEIQVALRASARSLGIPDELVTAEIHVSAVIVPERRESSDEDLELFNSFFEEDLHRVGEAWERGDVGPALRSYLTGEPSGDGSRLDLRVDNAQRRSLLDPALYPRGSWPAPGGHALVFSQQLALNAACEELRRGGLLAVNGPPGTGKTTMLRDLVAAVVVDRATQLASLAKPADAFPNAFHWQGSRYWRRVPRWRDELRGHELVVVSSNNGAVENVTLEIPATRTVDQRWLEGLDYFRAHAIRLAGEDGDARGLIAARLGRKAHRLQFARDLMRPYRGRGRTEPASQGLGDELKAWENIHVDWGAAVRRFKGALEVETRLRSELSRRHARVEQGRAARAELASVDARVQELGRAVAISGALVGRSADEVTACERELLAAKATAEEHARVRPAWFKRLFGGAAVGAWRSRRAEHGAAIERHASALAQAVDRERQARSAHARDMDSLGAAEATRAKLATAAADLSKLEAERALGWPDDPNGCELHAPWAEPSWIGARADLLRAALELHRAFIHALAPTFRSALFAVHDLLIGDAGGMPKEALPHVWSTLFFLVPVVSTTFASVDRMFDGMTREAIGWLLIDEAGQATPQSAVGALWRARRAIVVGDPMQLEPVVTAPADLLAKLRRVSRVAAGWTPGPCSVQDLADRASRLGATTEEPPGWVGVPLRAHRRCEEPMFSISNALAYGGRMVYATAERPMELPESCWFDVAGPARGHFIRAEAEVLLRELAGICHEIPPESIIVVSPFQEVVAGLRGCLRGLQGRAPRVTTVHRVQGKEAEVVYLVLGGNPRSPGARTFVTKSPHLVNVAVSRARRRLYVIGEHASWAGLPQVAELARRLPRR